MMPTPSSRRSASTRIDVFSFSLGGFIAQALVVKHPELVRKLVLTGTGPKGGKDIDRVTAITYWDMLRATLTRSDPKEFLFFNRNTNGKLAARAFVNRLKERTADRDETPERAVHVRRCRSCRCCPIAASRPRCCRSR
ncbi:alpha/beta hydrolase [Streptomyces sp. NPDC059385]|uniref:alpha/beta hydrolase n=1 Tax=Streptomyces sp. NPDC059385 TaxID=3346817 RepID=UPI00368EDD15